MRISTVRPKTKTQPARVHWWRQLGHESNDSIVTRFLWLLSQELVHLRLGNVQNQTDLKGVLSLCPKFLCDLASSRAGTPLVHPVLQRIGSIRAVSVVLPNRAEVLGVKLSPVEVRVAEEQRDYTDEISRERRRLVFAIVARLEC